MKKTGTESKSKRLWTLWGTRRGTERWDLKWIEANTAAQEAEKKEENLIKRFWREEKRKAQMNKRRQDSSTVWSKISLDTLYENELRKWVTWSLIIEGSAPKSNSLFMRKKNSFRRKVMKKTVSFQSIISCEKHKQRIFICFINNPNKNWKNNWQKSFS